MKLFLLLLLLTATTAEGQTKFQKDFIELWTNINENHAYLEKQGIDWKKVKEIYEPETAGIQSDSAFIRFLETVLNELHNGHISLNTNLASSNRLVPSGADLFAEKNGEKFYIRDIRKGSGAEQCGLRPGMEIVGFNGGSVGEQLKRFLPKYSSDHTGPMIQYALSMLLAGTHNTPRSITILEKGQEKEFYPDNFTSITNNSLLESILVNKKTGYIRINNSLGNNSLIKEFDIALDELLNTDNLVLDLTETPGGGNSTVARAIMGRFITKEQPYQRHEYDEKEFGVKRSWVEYVTPRGKTYKGKVFLMVSHWTGSMGEGIAIGFDAMKRATVIGTKMAGLIGAISGFRVTETKIGFQIPIERLYHVNGPAREDFIPLKLTRNIYETQMYVEKQLGIRLPGF